MNGIKEWVKKISEDKNFAKKFEGKSANEVSAIARKEGFNFTPDEYMDLRMEAVSGGKMDNQTKGVYKKIKKLEKMKANKSDFKKSSKSIASSYSSLLENEGDDEEEYDEYEDEDF